MFKIGNFASMKIIIVSATKFEIEPLLKAMESTVQVNEHLTTGIFKNHTIDFLITGIGMVATAFHCGRAINSEYNFALNVGICGSFNSNLEIGQVVNIVQDHFSELGAEEGEKFLSLKEIGLEGSIEMFNETIIMNTVLDEIPKVCGVTVNTVHGNDASIEKVFNKFHPNTESMEGAGFMFACEELKIKYAQIRCVSNYVEKRNKNNWNIPLAIVNLNKKIIEIIERI